MGVAGAGWAWRAVFLMLPPYQDDVRIVL
jgi:hypothetical protein